MKKHLYILVLFLSCFIVSNAQEKDQLIATAIANPGEPSSINLLEQAGGQNPNYNELNSAFKKLSKSVKKSDQGRAFARFLKTLENSSPGKMAPSITQFDLSGEPFSLSDLKEKIVLIDFWSSSNYPSRQMAQNLNELYLKFKDKGFEILGVSFDTEYEAWKLAIDQDKRTWKHISDLQGWNNYAVNLYAIKNIPQNILIDQTGRIISRNIYGEDLKKKLSELMP